MSCGCGNSETGLDIQQLDLESLTAIRAVASASATEGQETQRLWMIGGQPSIATGTADGKKGCVTIPYLGIPIKFCWEIKDADLIPPEVSIRIRVTISVSDVEFFSAILVFHCDNILSPSTCSVAIEGEHALVPALAPRCNWGCLRNCAPGCISCGTNYWCWAGCAASCVFRCCRL